MSAEIPAPLLLLLHQGGWDEVLMVAVGLGAAYLVIMWTGRRSNQDEDDDEDDDEGTDDADSATGQPAPVHDEPPHPKL